MASRPKPGPGPEPKPRPNRPGAPPAPNPGTYRVEFTSAAARSLAKLSEAARNSLGAVIEGLRANPRPRGVEKLKGRLGLYRVRSGDYRVVYTIEDGRTLVVTIVRVGHRRDVYDSL